MADLATSLFERYRHIMRVTFVGVLLVACALIYLQFERALHAKTINLAERMQEQTVALDAILKSSADAVNSMRVHAEARYRLHDAERPSSPLRNALHPCAPDGGVCLDLPPSPWTQNDVGNLTGYVLAPSAAVARELDMALNLNDTFRAIKSNIPEAAWVYYTSSERFINIYPWVASRTFFYADSLKEKAFFRDVTPERNPTRQIIWTPAYIDEAGKGLMVTTSAGVFTDGQFRGAVSLDLTLTQLNAFVRNWHAEFGTLFIVNRHGQLLAHPSLIPADAEKILPLSSAFPAALNGELRDILEASEGRILRTHGYYVETRTINNAPFRLVLIVPQWDLFRSSLQTGGMTVLLLVIGLTAMLVVANRLAYQGAVLPAQKLVRYIDDEGKGTAKSIPAVPPAWQPWFRTIQHVFNAHAQLISIQQELDVARRMQQSIVPKRFPTRENLQMFARMIPAKEVGGDFYDYFWLSDTKLGIVIADVSGKGVPAALFMAVSRTLLRAIAPTVDSPGATLMLANDLLEHDNDAAMFVTVFYGILDTRTGQLDYANGGHNSPYLVSPDGTVTALPRTDGMALGVIDGTPYAEHRIYLAPGSALLLYTDGITEAFNQNGEAYGEQRLTDVLARNAGLRAEPQLNALIEDVSAFAASAPQSDDITCLAVHYIQADTD
ncbi:SpoIIE family protein phosphatase [Ralstonia sp. UBA689]|uniref:SpoIIE family protein phosphatase n=1 Tax=Ralstonia sp. UBA689 TaxID=1947373 RepID=UPI0025CFB8B5|nr:SpoIIE family protein phosphatase [Ralstonia sp. UBA689]